MARSKKNAARHDADLLSTFHLGLDLKSLSYEQYVGLWLNIPRVRAGYSAMVSEGVSAANSACPIPFDWLDAFAESNEPVEGTNATEVELAQIRANASREYAEILAKYGAK